MEYLVLYGMRIFMKLAIRTGPEWYILHQKMELPKYKIPTEPR